MARQWIRSVGLIVSKNGKGLDLSEMHIQFQVFAPDTSAPPIAYIRVWNLKKETASKIEKEFDHVSLQAGYEDEPGIIFDGTIVQVKKGAEDAINRYTDIMCSDLDEFFNFTLVNKTLKAGSNQKDQLNAVIEAGKDAGATLGTVPDNIGTGGTLPRGKVLFGMGREQLTNISKTANASWFIQNGKVNLVQQKGYLPSEIIKLNSNTGMIGVPEATNNGVNVRCLLNPKIKVGCRVQIDNASITQTTIRQQGLFPTYGSISLPASTSADGVYRVLVAEHFGDNRGNQYETQLTCLSVDASAAPSNSVRGGK